MNNVAACVLFAIVSFIIIGEIVFQRSEARRRQSQLAQELAEEAPPLVALEKEALQ